MRTVRSETWLKEAAETEELFPSISVGGLAVRLGMYPSEDAPGPRMFGDLVNLLRRKAGLTIAELAALATAEERDIEQAEHNHPVNPELVSRLARALQIAEDKLAQLAGTTEPTDRDLIVAARRFEARLHTQFHLNPIEESALSEFLTTIHRS